MPGNSAVAIRRKERDAAAVALRRDKGLSVRAIAAELGCSHETARKAVNKYMARLDQACLEGVAAIRAEEYEKLDSMSALLQREIDQGNLDLVPAAVRVSESLRRLYAADVQALGRSELQMRRVVITEIATKLRDHLEPELFAQIASVLVADEPIKLMGNVAIEAADAEGAPPPRSWGSGQGATPGIEREEDAWPGNRPRSSGDATAVVDMDGRSRISRMD